MNQTHHIWWVTRELLPNKVCFARLCARKSLVVDYKKFLQRSHLVLSHLTQPTNGTAVDWDDLFLHLKGAKISLRFLGLRKDELIEFGGKSSLSLGHESKRWKCFLIKPLIDGKLGLYVRTKGKILLESLTLALSKSFLGILAALENSRETNYAGYPWSIK